MKVIVMNIVNVMVLVKQHYLMVIRMKDNINMGNDTELELIDFQTEHVI